MSPQVTNGQPNRDRDDLPSNQVDHRNRIPGGYGHEWRCALLGQSKWCSVEDPVGAMPKRNSVPSSQETPNLGQEAVHEGLDPIITMNALMATGMDPGKTLKEIGTHDPAAARMALDHHWRSILRECRSTLDLTGADWVTSLPEGIVVPYGGTIDLSGCRNFSSLPRSMTMETDGILSLVDSGWDGVVVQSAIEMDPGSAIRYSRDGQTFRFTSSLWKEVWGSVRLF